jgi:hypothetical protein
MWAGPSSIVLLLANLIPIAGVVWLDWQVFDILFLYWTESVIIGAVNVLRMISSQAANPLAGMFPKRRTAQIDAALDQLSQALPMRKIKWFIIPFFVLHYGMFCYGHLTAVVVFFSGSGIGAWRDAILDFGDRAFWIAVALIAVSHLYSYYVNFLGKGEFRRTGLGTLMNRPYGRIVTMHLAIIFGGFFVVWLGNPLPMLVVLIVVKSVLDLRLHNRERAKFALEA